MNKTEYLIMSAIKRAVTDTLDELGIYPESYSVDSLISPQQIRNIVIRQEFKEGRQNRIRAQTLYHELSVKYGLTLDSIHSIVRRKP